MKKRQHRAWRPWAAAAAVVMGMVATGCVKPRTSGMTLGAASGEDGSLQAHLDVDNARVARMLVVEDVHVGQTRNGLLRVRVRLASRSSRTYTAQSRFTWFDEEGLEVEPDGDAWRPLVMQGKETRTIEGVAPDARAASFRLQIREGERTRWIVR